MAPADSKLPTCLASDRLYLILLPTEACNLRCTYCFEDFSGGRMAPEVVAGVKRLLERRAPDLRALTLSWFGGEPLLARDLVEDVLAHARNLLGRHPRVDFSSDMTTNGYLLSRETFEGLVGLGVSSWYVTFDGPRPRHDARRVRPDGGGTFERIWRNVEALRDVAGDFEVVLRLHVDEENREDMPGFVATCRETFGGDPRFRLAVRRLARLGGSGDAELPVLGGPSADSVEASLREQAAGAQEEKLQACYAGWANSFIVRADGSLNKCSVAQAHPNNRVGVLREDGRLELDTPLMLRWMRGLRSGSGDELECPMIGLADGPILA